MTKFLLRSIDTVTGCSISEALFAAENDFALRQLLSDEDLVPGTSFELNKEELKSIIEIYSINMEPNADKGEIICVDDKFKFDPNSHTGKELRLMLEGTKPFAAFVDVEPSVSEEEIIPESFFAPFVSSNKFEKCVYLQLSNRPGHPSLRYVMYAALHETWRFRSYISLKKLGQKYGWNEGFERLEGFLLGYETEIDDFHLSFQSNKKTVAEN